MGGALYDHPRFLAGGGEMGALTREHDWAATPLGPPEIWPHSLRIAARLVLNSGQPMIIWWGGDFIQLHNDACRRLLGADKAEAGLGRRGREAWGESWEAIGPSIRQVMSGAGAPAAVDLLAPQGADGVSPGQWICSFSPIEDEDGGVGGVLAICNDVTEQREAANRSRRDEERLQQLAAELAIERDAARQAHSRVAADTEFLREVFVQAPSYMAVLRGADHVVQLANPSVMRLLSDRTVAGRPIRDVLPELAQNGYLDLVDRVLNTERPFVGHGLSLTLNRADGSVEERWLDVVLQPIRRPEGVIGVFVEAIDNTERREADQAQMAQQQRLQTLNQVAAQFAGQLDLDYLAQTTVQAGKALIGADFSVFFYTEASGKQGESRFYMDRFPPDNVRDMALPRRALMFAPIFQGQLVHFSDLSIDPHKAEIDAFWSAVGAPQMHSFLAAPVVSRSGQVIGGLLFGHRVAGAFGDADESAVVALARQASAAIDNASLYQAAQREILVRGEAEHQLALAIAATQLGTWDINLETRMLSASDRCRRMFDVPDDQQVSLREVFAVIHPEDAGMVREEFLRAIDPTIRSEYNVEYRIFGWRDGVERWIAARGIVVFDEEGGPVRVTGTTLDITARKRGEEHLRLLVNELNHRVKNSLAMVQAVAMQTFRNAKDMDVARAAFDARLVALAKAHDVLTAENWEGADLNQVLAVVVASHSSRDSNRFDLDGPDVRLSPKTAVSLSMALHELATNAVKYGALSGDQGRVSVQWRKIEGHLELTWREDGGPPVTPPSRKGFGSRLIEKGLAAELGGSARVTYAPQGVVCTIEAPIADEG